MTFLIIDLTFKLFCLYFMHVNKTEKQFENYRFRNKLSGNLPI